MKRARVYVAGEIVNGKTPDVVRAVVDRVAATKPNMVKIRVDDNLGTSAKMPPDVYKASSIRRRSIIYRLPPTCSTWRMREGCSSQESACWRTVCETKVLTERSR